MNPKGEVNNQPQFEMPPPQGYEGGQEQAAEKRPAQESGVGKRPPSPSATSTQVIQNLPAAPPPIATDDNTPPTSGATTKASDTSAAADADRIEKEWIDKAKAIVAKTQDDPYEQKNAMSRVKAEYIQKRFNKTIPTDDAVAV